MRSCSNCGETKPLTAFYSNGGGRYRGDCKSCISSSRAARYRTDPGMRTRLIEAARLRAEVDGDLLTRSCRLCGTEMKRSRNGTAGVCRACKRMLGYKVDISREERVAIYERDRWTCWLCDLTVDPNLHPNDRMAATLDHLEPRSLTLFPDDSPSNLRLAHRACNSARGARSGLKEAS